MNEVCSKCICKQYIEVEMHVKNVKELACLYDKFFDWYDLMVEESFEFKERCSWCQYKMEHIVINDE